MNRIMSLLLICGLCQLSACYYDNEEDLFQYVQQQDCNVTSATYATDIVPILIAHCQRCHRDVQQDGNVNLQGYNNVKRYADNGFLFGTANHENGYPVMPSNGVKIPACDIERLRVWIENGALNN